MINSADPNRLRISVAMCTYNGARYLFQQLDSIASQNRLPDELVICDDSSNDETADIARSFSTRAPFTVRLEINERNLGSTSNFEKAISRCRGDVIALADQDDVWRPRKLEQVEALFLASPSVGCAFSDADIIDEKGIPLGYRLWASVGFTSARQESMAQGHGTQLLLNRNVVTGATMAFRSKFRNLVLPIPSTWVQDGWIALLISAVADLGLIEEPLVAYRRHDVQQIGPLDLSLREQVEQAKKTGAQDYLRLAEAFRSARERLLTIAVQEHILAVLPEIEMKIKHLEVRARLAQKEQFRLPQVLEELLSWRYHRYSQGWKSAAKDLLN